MERFKFYLTVGYSVPKSWVFQSKGSIWCTKPTMCPLATQLKIHL